MTRFMLDTDTVSLWLKGEEKVQEKLVSLPPEQVCISVITLAELRYGARRRKSRRLSQLITTFAETVEVMPIGIPVAERFGEVLHHLSSKGVRIGPLDTLLAAHALAEGLTFVTNNTKHFRRVPGLRIENWAK